MTPEERRERRKHVETPTTPLPVLAASLYADEVGEDGVVGRYIFPGTGTLCGASAYCEEPLADITAFEAIAEEEDVAQQHTFRVSRKGGTLDLRLDVQAGTRLTVKAPPGCKKVFVGFLWQLGVA